MLARVSPRQGLPSARGTQPLAPLAPSPSSGETERPAWRATPSPRPSPTRLAHVLHARIAEAPYCIAPPVRHPPACVRDSPRVAKGSPVLACLPPAPIRCRELCPPRSRGLPRTAWRAKCPDPIPRLAEACHSPRVPTRNGATARTRCPSASCAR